jgi:ADP-heptose:LPS heptosyltransferase
MRIVALVPGGIGDQILFFPTLADLKKAYPTAEIDVVVEPRSKGAYRVCPSVSEVILFDYKDRNSPADWANLLGVIRDRYYDIALSLGSHWGVGLLLWLTGTPVRVGYSSGGNLFLTRSVPLKTEQYAAQMYHDLLTGLDITTPCPPLAITLPKSDIDWADGERTRLGLGDAGYVMIHAGCSELARQKGIDKLYPVANWKAIIQDFQNRQPDLPIVVAEGEADTAIVAELTQACPGVKVTRPDDIGKLAAMIAGANLMLCTDSAPMHLAVALQVYTLALFGPTDPGKLLPQNEKFQGIQSPTGKMDDLSPDTVLKVVWGG